MGTTADVSDASVSDLFRLDGRVALVTGAGRGLGEAFSIALADMGAQVFLVSRTQSELRSVCEAIKGRGGEADYLPCSVADISCRHEIVEAACRRFGKIDILVNCAGTSHPTPSLEATEEQWEATMNLNAKGTFFLTQAVAKGMIERRYGKIINIVSHLGFASIPGRCIYGASKAALVHMTRILGVEWAPYGINVNALAPSYTRTKLAWEVLKNEEFRDFVLDNTPLHRIAEPIDMCGAVVYLASDASRMMTGQTLIVDGGWTAR